MSDQACGICGSKVLSPVLIGRPDREYGVAAVLSYFRCSSRLCGHIQVVPVPTEDSIRAFYHAYTTHEFYTPSKMGSLLELFNRRIFIKQLRFLDAEFQNCRNLKILDFGCGNGILLKRLGELGYRDLIGFDVDPVAVQFVKSQGIMCAQSLGEIAQGSIDVVFLNHVIEHLPAPRTAIFDLLKLLRPGGILVIRTPNSQSTLSNICQSFWRGWETPRHLNLFTSKSLDNLVSEFDSVRVLYLKTSNDMLMSMAVGSLPDVFLRPKLLKWFLGFVLILLGMISITLMRDKGEEIVLIARKIE